MNPLPSKKPTAVLRTARRFHGALGPLLVAQIAMVVVVVTNGVSLMTLQPIVDYVFVSATDPVTWTAPWIKASFSASRVEVLAAVTAFFILSRLLYSVALYTQRFLMMTAGEIMVNSIRVDLYERLLSLSIPFYSRKRAGSLIANLTADLGVVQHLGSTVTADLIRRPFEIAFLIAILCWLDLTLAFYALLVAPFVVGIINYLGKAVRRRAKRMQDKMADLSDIFEETISGIRIIQAFAAEHRMARRFRDAAEHYFRRSKRAYAVMTAPTPSTEFVTAVAIGGILLYGGTLVIERNMTPGQFFTFMALLMSTYQPVKTLVNALAETSRATAALDRVYEVIDSEPTIRSGSVAARPIASAIEYTGVSFAYPDSADCVLHDISFRLPKGRTIALVGPSGVGKTTLLSLLPRFFDPTAGTITFDGVDLRDLDLASYRRMIGIVTQDTFLFNDTVAANIAFGAPEASEDDIRRSAAAAQIADTIERMPEGYRTIVGERGSRLSGGEKQRVAIARALLIDPPILLLDEATSALDSESEKKVQKAMDTLMTGRTTLVIAHRLTTIQHADEILVLDKGGIVERGRHDELIARNGTYARLYAIQFGRA